MNREDEIAGASAPEPAPQRIDALPPSVRRRRTSYRVTIRGRAMTTEEWSDLLAQCLEALGQPENGSER